MGAMSEGADLQERFMLAAAWVEKLTACLDREVARLERRNQDALLQVLSDTVARQTYEASGCFFWLEYEEELRKVDERYGGLLVDTVRAQADEHALELQETRS